MKPAAIVELALQELQAEGVESPSWPATLSMCRSIVIAGKAVQAGLHLFPGIVRVVVFDGDENGWARGEFVLDVRGDVEPAKVRSQVAGWADERARGLVRVREANVVDWLLSEIRWRWRRRSIESAIRVARRGE